MASVSALGWTDVLCSFKKEEIKNKREKEKKIPPVLANPGSVGSWPVAVGPGNGPCSPLGEKCSCDASQINESSVGKHSAIQTALPHSQGPVFTL